MRRGTRRSEHWHNQSLSARCESQGDGSPCQRPAEMAQRPAVRYTKGVPVLGQSIHADETDVAFILEKYASQLNQPGHQLWWTPGRGEPGRGIIYDSAGTVHTWPESEATH